MADNKNSKKKKDIKNFKEFDPSNYIELEPKLAEAVKKNAVVMSFGRMNPITIGHEKLASKVATISKNKGADPAIFLSHSTDKKKNPLPYEQKFNFARKAFGGMVKKSMAKTIIDVAKVLQNQYKNLIVVVGSDRVKEFETLLKKYNGKDYNFDSIEIVSAGARDPDADGVDGMSASKMRASAADDDLGTFTRGLPSKLKSQAKQIFNKVRQGMDLDEQLDEAVLSRTQRRKRALTMRKYKGKIALARKKAMRKTATFDKIKSRARKTARNMMKDRLAKSKRFADLPLAQRQAIEKKLEKMPPARLDRLAKRLIPSVKKKEKARLQGRREDFNLNNSFEMFMEERTPVGRFGKNTHDIKVKVPGRINKAIKKAGPVFDQRENKPHQETKKHLSDIMKKHGVKPSKAKHYHNDMTGHYMMAHPSNDPAKVHAAATEFEKTVGKAVRTEEVQLDDLNSKFESFLEGAGFQPAMMLNPKTKKKIIANRHGKDKSEQTNIEEKALWGQRISKKPHMMLNANNTVKFDGRFKMYKKRDKVEEGFELNSEITDLENSLNEFLELHEGKTIKVDHRAALSAESAGYILVKDREVVASGTMDEMLEMHENTPGSRVWLSTAEVGDLVEAEDPDIGDRKGSQPAGYHKGIKSKSTKIKRDQHFKKYAEKDSDKADSQANYKPAPGDATAKTKPSRHTKKFKDMYGEDAVATAKKKIETEKRQDARRHDRAMDAARLRKARAKNRATKP